MSDRMIFDFATLAFIGLMLTFAALVALMRVERQRSLLLRRLKRTRGTGPEESLASPRQSGSLAHMGATLKRRVLRLGDRLSVFLGGEARETANKLASAGYQGRDALLVYAFLKTVLPVVFFGGGAVWLLMTRTPDLTIILPAAVVIGGALGLSLGVDFVVDARRSTRMSKIRMAFPDMLELLVISSEAGLGPQQALHRVARKMRDSAPELAAEILQTVSELSMTGDKRAAFERLGERVPLSEISVFVQTLEQTERYGTPFSKAMRVLIAEQRANRLVSIEEKAARLPVIMTLPLIFCIMPAVFVVLVGPAALSILDNILAGG